MTLYDDLHGCEECGKPVEWRWLDVDGRRYRLCGQHAMRDLMTTAESGIAEKCIRTRPPRDGHPGLIVVMP